MSCGGPRGFMIYVKRALPRHALRSLTQEPMLLAPQQVQDLDLYELLLSPSFQAAEVW